MTRTRTGRRPTMRDVAEAAGVSPSLVSIVFRGISGASDSTRERVLKVADDLGYIRDESARALRAQRATTIGVCFEIQQPFHHKLVDNLYSSAEHTRYPLMLSPFSATRPESAAIRDLLSRRCGAMILMGSSMTDEEMSALAAKTPVVSVTRRSSRPEVDWVTSDDRSGMEEAVDHLVGLGHSRVLFLTCPQGPGAEDRLQAFERVAQARGLSGTVQVAEGGRDERSGVLAAELLLRNSCPAPGTGAILSADCLDALPTAIIAFNDRCAHGAADALLRRGVRIPEDMSLIGFDDSEVASWGPIGMTSVRQDTTALARISFERAVQRLSQTAPFVAEPEGSLVPTTLIIRSSTGPARHL